MTALHHDHTSYPNGTPNGHHPNPGPDPDDTTTPPHDDYAEQCALGGMLLNTQALTDTLLEGLDPTDFYRPAHELIAETIHHLHGNQHPADPATVTNHLRTTGNLNRAGGPAYIHTLISTVPTAANAGYYARIVRTHAHTRQWLTTANRITQTAHTNPDQLHELATQLLTTHTHTTPDHATTWQPLPLDTYLDGTHPTHPPTICTRNDGQALLYPSAVHSISGEPESGKSWLALYATTQQLAAGHTVTYIDFEDRPERITARLLAAGATPAQIRARFRYVRPEAALDATSTPHLTTAATGATLVVLDGVTEAMTLHGLELTDNTDVAKYLEMLPRRLADTGAAVLQIDHVVKNSETRGRYAIGGQHKLAGIDGAAYKITVTEPFGRGKKGHARITVDKDREGHVRANALGTTIATLTLDSTATDRYDSDTLRVHLDAPRDDTGDDGQHRPTGYMEKVSRYLETHPGTNLRQLNAGVAGKREHITRAVQVLTHEGYLRVEDGPNRQQFHWIDTPYREDQE